MGRLIMKMVDADVDYEQFSVPTADAAADGSDYSALFAGILSLRDAITAVTLGGLKSQGVVTSTTEFNPSIPANNFCQVNTRWVVEYRKTTDGTLAGLIPGGPYTIKIPTADLSLGVVRNGRVELDLSAGVGQTLKNALQARMRDEDDNQVIVDAIYHQES